MFITNKRGGFGILFENDYQISVTWGVGSYSENYDLDLVGLQIPPHSKNAEIAVYGPQGDFVNLLDICGVDDVVAGYKTVKEVFEIIKKVEDIAFHEDKYISFMSDYRFERGCS